MVGVERERVLASEPRRRPARREEDLVRRLPDVVLVEALELPEGPNEVVFLVEKVAALVVVAGVVVVTVHRRRKGTGIGFSTAVLTHSEELASRVRIEMGQKPTVKGGGSGSDSCCNRI